MPAGYHRRTAPQENHAIVAKIAAGAALDVGAGAAPLTASTLVYTTPIAAATVGATSAAATASTAAASCFGRS